MNIDKQNSRFATLDSKIKQLASQFAQFANEMKASMVLLSAIDATPTTNNELRERPVEKRPHIPLVVVELDPISEVISVKMEEENNKRFAKLEERLQEMQGYED